MGSKSYPLAKKLEARFKDWADTLNQYYQTRNLLATDQELADRTDQVAELLGEMSDIFISYCSARDKFDNSKMHLNIFGPQLHIRSEKMGCDFHFGLGQDCFCLSASLKHIENIMYVGDEFYNELLELKKNTAFTVSLFERYSHRDFPDLEKAFSGKKSSIYRIILYGILATSGEVRHPISPQLEVKMSYDRSFNDIILDGALAFKAFYKSNYELWKITNQKLKGPR